MCDEAGLRLHKFATNDEKVLQAIPKENRAEKTQHDIMPSCNSIERALGIQWCIKSGTFRYKIVLKDRPATRRGILSTVQLYLLSAGFPGPVYTAWETDFAHNVSGRLRLGFRST